MSTGSEARSRGSASRAATTKGAPKTPQLQSIDLNLLVAFEALWVERSVTRAGRRLGLSQPATSGALARLRTMLGDPLFVRERNALAPTERCLALAPAVADALASLRAALEGKPFDPRTSTESFTIGAVDAAIAVVAPPLVRAVVASAPNVRLSIVAIDPTRAAALLEDDALDVALAPVDDAPSTIASRALFPIALAVVHRKGLRLSATRDGAPDFADAPCVAVAFPGLAKTPIDVALAQSPWTPRVVATVDSFLAVPHLLASVDAVAILPLPFARAVCRDGAFVMSPLPSRGARAPLTMRLLWSRRRAASAPSEWIRARVVDAVTEAIRDVATT
jgi:DNA-binding transcriptional LysR family regulator